MMNNGRRLRYQRLCNDGEAGSHSTSEEAADGSHMSALNAADDQPSAAPPAYQTNSNELSAAAQELPSYNIAVDLPTYDESMRAKQLDEENQSNQSLSIHEMSPQERRQMMNIVGTDGMFVLGFIFAFLFNWVGLVAAFCLMRTCAGRFGALSGFGLSMVKWVTIAKHNNWSVGVADENPWVWWLLVTFGVLISCSGTLQYLRIKYLWTRSRDVSEATRYLF